MEDFFEEEEKEVKQSSFNIQHYFAKLLANFYWIIACVIIALSGGWLYLRYQVSSYEIAGYILIGGGELEGGTNAILNSAGLISSSDGSLNTINNEIFILKSYKIIGNVVDSLHLDLDIFEDGKFKDQPVFKDSLPVKIDVKKPLKYVNSGSPICNLYLNNNGFELKSVNKKIRGKYGVPVVYYRDTIVINKKDANGIVKNKEYTLKIQGRLSTIKRYRSRISVAQARTGGMGLLQISIVDELPAKGYQVIDELIDAYNASYLNYKNQAIRRALKFLDQRLSAVSEELDRQEGKVRDFKTNNRLYSVSSVATEMLSKIESGDLQKSQNAYQADLLNLIEKSIKDRDKQGNEEIVATTSGVADAVLAGQVATYNQLVRQKQDFLAVNVPGHPALKKIDDQLINLREGILKNITNIRKQLGTYNSFLSRENNAFADRFEQLPEKDKQYVELNRRLSVQESLYTFILQKKEETELQLVSEDVIRSRTVDEILNQGLVSPNTTVIYATSFVIGFLLPCLVIFLIVFLNKKIESRKEIEEGANAPILGELSMSELSGQPIAITSTNRSAIAEQFRSIRTNLSYIGAGKKQKVFVVTSSISGEGKSFVSLNLANSMAIIEKKVVVIELDLRKPALSNKFGMTGRTGISEYLVDEKIKPEDIVSEIEGHPNLHLIGSGPIPPNPGELITSERMAELISALREKYDYIIMDTPPVGLVADSISLGQLADTTIFVIRHKYSYRSSLNLVNDLKINNKLPNLSLVINGIATDNSYGYGYGYGYGGYGYGYYSDESEKESGSVLDNIKTVFKRKK